MFARHMGSTLHQFRKMTVGQTNIIKWLIALMEKFDHKIDLDLAGSFAYWKVKKNVNKWLFVSN